jgi:hypothetical protein
MNPRTRRIALYAIAVLAVLASADALAHSYAGMYGWAVHHRLGGWQAWSWPAEIDVFLVAGELALYVAYLDAWPRRQRVWPWVTAVTGLSVSVAGNIGHVQAISGAPVTLADRFTAAASPVAAFAGLMIGLLVLKMSYQAKGQATVPALPAAGPELGLAPSSMPPDTQTGELPAALPVMLPCPGRAGQLLDDAARIIEAAHANGERVSQRVLAGRLRGRGHRFSNAQLRIIVSAIDSAADRPAA